MTTVSKPNKNPASADVMDQKKMRDFMGELVVDLFPNASAAVHRHLDGQRAAEPQKNQRDETVGEAARNRRAGFHAGRLTNASRDNQYLN